MTVDTKTVRHWLKVVHGKSPGLMQICSKGRVKADDDWTGRTFSTDALSDAVTYVALLDAQGQEGIYLRTTTLKAPPGEHKRGGNTDTKALSYLWADMDIAGPGHAESNLPPNEGAIKDIIKASGLPEPSLWVHSGGGFYPIWLLNEPHVVKNQTVIKDLAASWQKIIEDASARSDYHYGRGIGDLSRVLRIPGTTNRKEGLERPCQVLSNSKKRYTLDELVKACADGMARIAPPKREPDPLDPLAPGVHPKSGLSPGDDFNARATWTEILEPHGWKFDGRSGEKEYWTRPGKNEGISATVNALGTDRFHVFTTAAGPFEGLQSYSKFGAYATLEHRGDFRAAAQALADRGYGERRLKVVPSGPSTSDEESGRRVRFTPASSIKMRATRWLWEEDLDVLSHSGGEGKAKWLPLGGLILLGGREGIGKTTWAYRLAAQVSTGTLPGTFHGEPRGVAVAATEDSWAHTIVPRLVAAGADLSRIFRADVLDEDMISGLTLPRDTHALRELCDAEGVALLVCDPLMGMISGTLDSHKDHEVRRALEPLSRLAHDAQLTVLGLIHVNKSVGSDLLTRLMASRAFTAVARGVLFASREESEGDDDETGPPGQENFLFGQEKNNLGMRVPYTIRYHIEGIKVDYDKDLEEDIWSSRVVPDDAIDGRIGDLVQAQESKKRGPRGIIKEKAAQWLRAFLANHDGPIASASVKNAARVAGFSEATIKRAREKDPDIRIIPLPENNKETAWVLDESRSSYPQKPDLPDLPDLHDLLELHEPGRQTMTNKTDPDHVSHVDQVVQDEKKLEPDSEPDPTTATGGPSGTSNICCEGEGLRPKCKLCPSSPNYHRKSA